MNKYKVIVMDIDGTLTNDNKVISEKTKATLMKAQEKGITLVLASGRPTNGLVYLAKELEMDKHNGLLISFNGSKIIDCETEEVLFNEPLKIKDGKDILEHMKNFDVIPMIYKNDYMYVNDVYNNLINVDGVTKNIIEYEARNCRYKICEIDDLADFANYPMSKVLVAGNPEYLEKHYNKMMEPFKDTLNCVFTSPFYFEYTAQGIDKAKALDAVLSKLGHTKDEVIAFGDGHNDKTMIEYAGLGVAMDNAVQDLKDVANYITLSNNDDGIADALNIFLDL